MTARMGVIRSFSYSVGSVQTLPATSSKERCNKGVCYV
jgi:hypothetical protein